MKKVDFWYIGVLKSLPSYLLQNLWQRPKENVDHDRAPTEIKNINVSKIATVANLVIINKNEKLELMMSSSLSLLDLTSWTLLGQLECIS